MARRTRPGIAAFFSIRRNRLFVAVAAGTFLLDALVKQLVRSFLSVGEDLVVIPGLFALTRFENTGASFSILEGWTPFLAVFSVLIGVGIIHYYARIPGRLRTPFALVLGGTAGNLIDRVAFGTITDMFAFKLGGVGMPIFNVADIAVFVGGAAILLYLIRAR
ncbi:signal peptidase II [Candidatus Woesearchaeota archaeon]|nr:signal peptidase II [Candidatus Woesearchaeota archaeon]